MKKKAEIVFETEETVTFSARRVFAGYCAGCDALAEMMTTEIAAVLSGIGEREIFRLIERAELHFTEAERVFVCRKSLEIYAEIPKFQTKDIYQLPQGEK